MTRALEAIKKWGQTFSEDRFYIILDEAQEYVLLSRELANRDETAVSEEEEEVVSYFHKQLLPLLVRNVLRRRIVLQNERDMCFIFLRDVLTLIVTRLDEDHAVLLQLLVEIFAEDAKFYMGRNRLSGGYTSGSHNTQSGDVAFSPSADSPLAEEDRGEFASPPRHLAKPAMLVDLINHFGKIDGFKDILERISDSEFKLRVDTLLFYLKAIEQIRQCFKSAFLDTFAIDLKEAVFDRILGYGTEEFKATTKASLVSVVEHLSAILMDVMPSEQVGEVTERFQLDVSLKCLGSPSLEKRLQGLQVINSLIEMAARKETTRSFQSTYGPSGYSYPSTVHTRMPTTKWLSSSALLSWIQENKIVDELFGEKMHQELLKRSNDLFRFITSNGKLTTEHLDALWGSCMGKDEPVMSAIFQIIADLVLEPNFSDELLEDLMAKLVQLPVKEYTNEFVTMLGEFAERCDEKVSPVNAPMKLMWEALMDQGGASEEVFQHTLVVFGRFLGSLRSYGGLLNQCTDNLMSHTSTPQSILILRQIIDQFPVRVYQTPPRPEMLL